MQDWSLAAAYVHEFDNHTRNADKQIKIFFTGEQDSYDGKMSQCHHQPLIYRDIIVIDTHSSSTD